MILLSLLLNSLLSLLATGLFFFAWLHVTRHSSEEQQALGMFCYQLAIAQTVALLVCSLPILFQINAANLRDRRTRILYLYAAPLFVTLLFSFFLLGIRIDIFIWCVLIAPSFFVGFNYFFYSRLAKKL